MSFTVWIVLLFAKVVYLTIALENGLDLVPPMGWSNWESLGCNINEEIIRQNADALVDKGLRDAGYTMVGLDDCWAELGRNASGYLVPNAALFPSGLKSLADYLHDRGLKFRIYSSAGLTTCQRNMSGSLGYEWLDAQLFASWGVDALKYDDCAQGKFREVLQDAPRRFPFTPPPILRFPIMALALNRTGRKISYLCNFPWDFWKQQTDQALGGHWVMEMCNSWRTGPDSRAGFDVAMSIVEGSEKFADLVPSGPGRWNHLDALQIGNNHSCAAQGDLLADTGEAGASGMSEAEEQIVFSLFALVKTPLMIGANVVSLSGHSLATYLNAEVIAVNQDPLGARGRRVAPAVGRQALASLPDGCELWSVRLADGGVFVVLLNRNMPGTPPTNISAAWEDLGLEADAPFMVRDTWKHLDLGVFTQSFRIAVSPRSCVAVRLREVERHVGLIV